MTSPKPMAQAQQQQSTPVPEPQKKRRQGRGGFFTDSSEYVFNQSPSSRDTFLGGY